MNVQLSRFIRSDTQAASIGGSVVITCNLPGRIVGINAAEPGVLEGYVVSLLLVVARYHVYRIFHPCERATGDQPVNPVPHDPLDQRLWYQEPTRNLPFDFQLDPCLLNVRIHLRVSERMNPPPPHSRRHPGSERCVLPPTVAIVTGGDEVPVPVICRVVDVIQGRGARHPGVHPGIAVDARPTVPEVDRAPSQRSDPLAVTRHLVVLVRGRGSAHRKEGIRHGREDILVLGLDMAE